MSKISNVLTMIEYLSTGRKYSISELSEKLEVTPRMIRVYKDEIEKAGIYIDTIKGPYGGYVLNQNINVPKRFITPNEINVKDKNLFNLINRAIKEKRKCLIEYYSKKEEEISKRTIHPYDLILLGNEWGVAAYCESKEEIRHFYINRIKSIKILEKRILSINDPLLNKANDIREILYQLTIDNKPTLIVATGGSKVVAYYLQLIIERLGIDRIICEVIEPRDYFYKVNRNKFSNLIVISTSGNTNGIKEVLDDFNGSKFLITQNNQEVDYQIVSWGNEKYDTEKSFISLASSLGPITLMLDATTSLNMEIGYDEIKKINDKIKELLIRSREKIDKISVNFKDIFLIQIMSGYETKTSSSVLESNLVEVGLASSVIHDKGSFCHGRNNLLFQYPNSHVIYLCHQRRELDNILIELINKEYSNISIFDTEDIKEDYFWKEYYLILQMYFLSKKIADDKKIDLTQPEYDPKLVKKLYNFRGEM